MSGIKRPRNLSWKKSRSSSASARNAAPAPYPVPATPDITSPSSSTSGFSHWLPSKSPEPSPPPPPPSRFSNLTSMSRDERALTAGVLAVVTAVGIGIGYALPGGFTDESIQPAATIPAPVANYPADPAPEVGQQDVIAPPVAADPAAPADLAPAADVLLEVEPSTALNPAPEPGLAPPPPPQQDPVPVVEPVPEVPPAPPPPPAYFKNCSEVRAAGAAPVFAGQPGYGNHLDRDGDGIGCDT